MSEGPAALPRGRAASVRRWPYLLLGLALLWFFPFQEQLNNPNENVRLYLTRALVEHGTATIGWRVREGGRLVDRGLVAGEWGWVNDRALICDEPGARAPSCTGRLLAAKAPGVSLLGVPPYLLLSAATRELAGRPPSKAESLRVLRAVVVTLPWLFFLVALHRWLLRREWCTPDAAELTVLGLGLGSIATPYALLFAGHTLGALLLGGAWLLLHEARARAWPTLAGGLLLGTTILVEYPLALPAGAIGLLGLAFAGRGRWPRAAGLLLLGLLPPLGLLLGYHQVVLGSPFATPYAFLENPAFVRDAAPGLHGIALPGARSLLLGLFSPQVGLFFFWPAALLGLAGGVSLLRERETRLLGAGLLLVCLVFGYLLAAMPNLRKMLGWTVGPRYIVGVAPFLAIGLARAGALLAGRWPRAGSGLVRGLVLGGVVLCGVPALLYGTYPMSFRNPSFQLGIPLLLAGYWPHSVGTTCGLSGLAAALPGLVGAAGVLVALAWGPRPSSARCSGAWRGLLATGTALLLLGLLSLPGRGAPSPDERREADWVRRRWEPPPSGIVVPATPPRPRPAPAVERSQGGSR